MLKLLGDHFCLTYFHPFPESFLSSQKTMILQLVLAATLQVALERLAPRSLEQIRGYGLRKMLDKWNSTKELINAFLSVAVEQQHTDKPVNRWLDDLTDVAYDVDDIQDEFEWEVVMASTSKVWKFIPTCFTDWTPTQIWIRYNLRQKVKKVTALIDNLMKRKDVLHWRESTDVSMRIRKEVTPSTSLGDGNVYGRNEDKDVILSKLFTSERSNNDAEIPVIPISGKGGIGKTTLAQLVFNDKSVQSNFELKVWIHVSEVFDVFRLTKTILVSVISQLFADQEREKFQFQLTSGDLNLLQEELHKLLTEKRILLVLDDVWSHPYGEWDKLRASFQKVKPGSRIIITTRDQGVLSQMGTVGAHHLHELSGDDCVSIFSLHALQGSAAPNIENLHQRIIGKCKGSPLAAKTYGGLLHSNEEVLDHRKWNEVLNPRILDTPEERAEILSVFMRSYVHLSSELKMCFAHCSILPMGYTFEEKQLILLWIAEGLIQLQEWKEMEDLGNKYFQELVQKSFFQKLSNDESQCGMHDFINYLAQQVARGTSFSMDDRSEETLIKARHLSVLCGQDNCRKNFQALSEHTGLRSFLHYVPPNQEGCQCNCNFPLRLLSQFRSLRVLSLSGCRISKLPKSIGYLKHLRHLDVSNTNIESLPESISTLYNLQSLELRNCSQLKKLPAKFWNLVHHKLRRVNIQGSCSLEEIPKEILENYPNLLVR